MKRLGRKDFFFLLLFSVCLFLFPPPPPPTTCNYGVSAAVARVQGKETLLVRLIGPWTLCQDRVREGVWSGVELRDGGRSSSVLLDLEFNLS